MLGVGLAIPFASGLARVKVGLLIPFTPFVAIVGVAPIPEFCKGRA